MKSIFKFFDKLEDKVHSRLARYPLVYALVGGVAIVLFWRGVWHAADAMDISWQVSLIASVIIMLLTGLFVSFFVGDNIILSGLKHEKKLAEKTEEEIKTEKDEIFDLKMEIDEIKNSIDEIKNIVSDKK
ncbi:MAG: hypothetical protein WC835_02605 [Candidatus Paceibacterota bacterium]|jgi:hypothetical protein